LQPIWLLLRINTISLVAGTLSGTWSSTQT